MHDFDPLNDDIFKDSLPLVHFNQVGLLDLGLLLERNVVETRLVAVLVVNRITLVGSGGPRVLLHACRAGPLSVGDDLLPCCFVVGCR